MEIGKSFKPTGLDHQQACPQCQSSRIQCRDYARRAGGTVGLAAGAVVGTSSALGGAETGLAVGFAAGPLGAFAGALIGGLVCAAAGCVAGARLGSVIDDQVLDNYCCLACGHSFSSSQGNTSLSE